MSRDKGARLPIFLSTVCVIHDHADKLPLLIHDLSDTLQRLVNDYEIIIVENASRDNSLSVLKDLVGELGEPNIQVYALSKKVDSDTGAWIGLEKALGDFIAVVDPLVDDLSFLSNMLESAVDGADVVFATNLTTEVHSLPYRLAHGAFNRLYELCSGVHLASQAPRYRVLGRNVANFILQHPRPAISYRHLPATGGFIKLNLTYRSQPKYDRDENLLSSIDRGMQLLVSTTRAPMRLVTSISLFGAYANLIYSLYVVGVALFQENVAPGWVSMSLQQSGMFFLISLVLFVLGEYIVNMVLVSNDGPGYHIAQEFGSINITRYGKLNIEGDSERMRSDQQISQT
ncbi:MAG: glycosyltransferase [Pseudomonadota bacterium]|jgi:glycosyltransferase involved in cell wall biosynthesis